jgi:3-oxoacyl-[acyl-carrier protein] reductase
MNVEQPGKSFAGKNVLVTGGARGLGFEIARQFVRAGAAVHLFDVDGDLLGQSVRDLAPDGAAVMAWRVDVSHREEVEKAVAGVEARGQIDVLVNNAGIARESGFLHIEEREWRQILDVNLTGMFFVAQAVCRTMATRRRGVVINMASKNGLDGEAGYAHYNASKGGVVMLTKTMALELAHLGIRVNAVSPGYIQTPMSQEIDSPAFVQDFVDRYIPLGRPGRVEDVAPAFLFLASDAAAFITGQVLTIDGGQLAGQKPSDELIARLGAARSD